MNLILKGHWAITFPVTYIFPKEKQSILLNEWRNNRFLACVNGERSMTSTPSILASNIYFFEFEFRNLYCDWVYGLCFEQSSNWFEIYTFEFFGEFSNAQKTPATRLRFSGIIKIYLNRSKYTETECRIWR